MSDPAYRDVPASEAQQGLWLLRSLGREPAPRCRTYRVVGDLDVAALAAAWRSLVDRHEGLRSALLARDGVPVRRVWERAGKRAFRLREGGRGKAAEGHQGPVADGGPDLVGVPTGARMTVTAFGPKEHRVHVAVPRAFADDDFLDRLVEELSELCAGKPLPAWAPGAGADADAGAAGTDPETLETPEIPGTPEAPEAPDTPEAAEALAWWVKTLTPLPSELPLPADHPRPERASGRWGEIHAPADARLGRAVAHCAEARGSDPFTVLLTAFQVLLHRYTGGDRVAVAVPVSSGTPGAGANVLILPADIAPGHRFEDVLDRGTATTAEAMARRDVPLARVLGALPVVRDARRVPLSEVVLDYRDRPRPVPSLPGAVVEPCPEHGGPAPADLVLRVDDGAGGPAFTLLYDADQYRPATARMILRQFRTLLRHSVRSPEVAVGELALDSPGRAARALGRADRRAEGGTPRHTSVEAIRRRAERDPDTVAVDGPDGTLTYRALQDAASHVAADLRAAGVRAGDAVVVRQPVGVRQYAALLGVLAAGAHVSWSGTADSGDRGRAVLEALKPAAMLVAAGTTAAPDAAEASPAHAEGAHASGHDELVDWYRATIGGRVVTIAEPGPAPARSALPAPPRLTDRAYVAFTSGTTGVPKGIAHQHGTLAQFAAWMATEFEIGPGVRVAQWVAAEHDPALAETFAALGSGATLCPVPAKIRANPERLLDWLAAERVGVLQTVPSFARELLRVLTERRSAEGLGTLRVLLLMGEALPGELAEGLLNALPLVRLANLYGPTETVAATWYPVRRGRPPRGVRAATAPPPPAQIPIGHPIPGRGVLVVDPSGRVCPAGVTGELVVTGPYVADGYLGVHDHAAFTRLPHTDAPCYRTGDLARRRPDGTLEYRGRKDSQVKLYGSRLELTDVEAALGGHPAVADCAVLANADRDGLATRLVICVVPRHRPDGTPEGSPSEWRAHLRRRFGRSLLPALYRTLDRLPRTVTGKVDRPRLAREVAAAERDAVARRPAPGTETELAALWTDVLGTPPSHADQGFFAAGGTSLLVPRLLHQIRQHFAADVTAPQFYAHQSLAALAALVDRIR
ncbi:putative AMP-dependent synthetase and ligase [Streptomyces sp. Tu6071]|uniref:non-ribosomal peptide synthetase n=1 Tax=Streptomyces sp. Tu6071 TaxID=355249 RepID=UPI00020E636D|nr:non-ribosomal peptide synthetase [Streptomyces sp. Tu6071]EGJ77097.1 putative AMP-dependent synthetase and ligase [Streptomyces sp. Tu6071]